MKKLLMLCLLAACELQPAPKQAPPPAPSGSAAGSAEPVAVAPPPDAGVVTPPDAAVRVLPPALPVQPTAECQKAAVRYTELFIAAAPAAQKGIFEQDRANTVRRTEIACTQQGWTNAALGCIDQAKTDRDARACLEKFPVPGATPGGIGSNGKPYHPPRD